MGWKARRDCAPAPSRPNGLQAADLVGLGQWTEVVLSLRGGKPSSNLLQAKRSITPSRRANRLFFFMVLRGKKIDAAK